MNKRHKNIKFAFENEKDNSFFFLDVKICRAKNKFTANVFRKDTFSGVYTNFSTFVALKHKSGLVCTLLHRSFTILSDFILKLKHLRKHFTKILIPLDLLTNVWQKLLIIYLFKNLPLRPFQNWNLE